ncbi:receptor-type adenylate cyclase [Trypanosoma rangeli]|uniref:Receptor-type adenylate cyclase n=1 Tax=Trypanosoma rangeli TaxID=5698 RepID=A0A422MT04_TRYRA|nr:receptor-type adenylate cyclase [Trypanosoma rangeli]RNE96330.1 receptor-type adenylate cyclase [Trypanosoma rangeli]|eukprot:RNE96330.1 receptor-type adenylate cyclase [Trypanosoma rangeli]
MNEPLIVLTPSVAAALRDQRADQPVVRRHRVGHRLRARGPQRRAALDVCNTSVTGSVASFGAVALPRESQQQHRLHHNHPHHHDGEQKHHGNDDADQLRHRQPARSGLRVLHRRGPAPEQATTEMRVTPVFTPHPAPPTASHAASSAKPIGDSGARCVTLGDELLSGLRRRVHVAPVRQARREHNAVGTHTASERSDEAGVQQHKPGERNEHTRIPVRRHATATASSPRIAAAPNGRSCSRGAPQARRTADPASAAGGPRACGTCSAAAQAAAS